MRITEHQWAKPNNGHRRYINPISCRRPVGVYYNDKGLCSNCGKPGTGFVEDGVCMCLDY